MERAATIAVGARNASVGVRLDRIKTDAGREVLVERFFDAAGWTAGVESILASTAVEEIDVRIGVIGRRAQERKFYRRGRHALHGLLDVGDGHFLHFVETEDVH